MISLFSRRGPHALSKEDVIRACEYAALLRGIGEGYDPNMVAASLFFEAVSILAAQSHSREQALEAIEAMFPMMAAQIEAYGVGQAHPLATPEGCERRKA